MVNKKTRVLTDKYRTSLLRMNENDCVDAGQRRPTYNIGVDCVRETIYPILLY